MQQRLHSSTRHPLEGEVEKMGGGFEGHVATPLPHLAHPSAPPSGTGVQAHGTAGVL